MANIQSQKKRNRTNEKRRQKNSQVKSAVRSSVKKLGKSIETAKEEDIKAVEGLFISFTKIIDTAAGKRIYHKNTAARKKSRLMKRINALKKASAQ